MIETSRSEDLVQTGPLNGVESFLEVKLENGSTKFMFVAAAKKISRINEVFCDAPPLNKPGLVGIDDGGDGRSEPIDHDLCEQLHGAILQGNRSESVSTVDALLLGKKDKQCMVKAVEIQATGMEASEQAKNVIPEKRPELFVERWAEPIWPQTGMHIHRE